MPFAAVYDACVLYPFEVRDLLMYAAYTRLFRVHWSNEILNECTRNLIKDGRASEAGMKRMVSGMNKNFPDADTPKKQYEHLIPSMTCDKKDRHILAVAVVRKVDVIVTYNHKHFPKSSVQPHFIETQDPDDFISDVIDLDVDLFMEWYHKMVSDRIKVADRNNRPPPTSASIAKFLAEGPMPKTGKCILQWLR